MIPTLQMSKLRLREGKRLVRVLLLAQKPRSILNSFLISAKQDWEHFREQSPDDCKKLRNPEMKTSFETIIVLTLCCGTRTVLFPNEFIKLMSHIYYVSTPRQAL